MISGSIRNKLIVFLLIAIIVPVSTSIIITYFSTKRTVTDETIANSSNLIFQGKMNITNYLNVISQASLFVYNDPSANTGTSLFEIINEGRSDFTSEKEINRSLQVMSHTMNEIEQVQLYVTKSNQSYRVFHDLFKREETYDPAAKPELAPGISIFQAPHPLVSYGMPPLLYTLEKSVISLHRSIYDVRDKTVLGTLSIDIRPDIIRSICEQLYAAGQEELYILDQQGTVVYSPNPLQIGKPLAEEWVHYLNDKHELNGSFPWASKEFSGLHIYERIVTPNLNWTLVKRIPNQVLYKNARHITEINSFVSLLFLIVVIGATVYISFFFTNPIKKLIRYINKIETGQLNVTIDMQGKDEFGVLTRRFGTMMHTINDLILREYRLELANKTNELKALQAQINPHFLNNALQSIGTLALQHDQPKMYSLISSLAKMMRYSMNTNESVVPLQKEIDYVKAYLELQEQRFGEQLQSRFSISPDCMAIHIPKMTLQPIIENYFKHGDGGQQPHREINISCALEDNNQLRIEVCDNGRGMTLQELAVLQEQLETGKGYRADHIEHIGLGNVLSRLKLFFNEQAAMKLELVQPHGFRVILLIPAAKGEERS